MIFSHNILPLLLTHLLSGWKIILQSNCITQKFPPYARLPAQLWANQSSHSAPAKQGHYSHPSQWCQQWHQSLLHAARSLQNCNGHHPLHLTQIQSEWHPAKAKLLGRLHLGFVCFCHNLHKDLEEWYASFKLFNYLHDWGLFPKYSQVL